MPARPGKVDSLKTVRYDEAKIYGSMWPTID